MMSRNLLIAALASLIALSPPVLAHDQHPPGGDTVTTDAGTAHFANSGAARAQAPFLRGILLLHSFEYRSARKEFLAAQQADPGFALAYWGEALTYNQPLWRQQDPAAARAALAKLGPDPAARAARAATARERAYLASVETLYGEGAKSARDAAYSADLGRLAAQYPDDLDARAFYALSLIALTGGERNTANYMRAAAEAEAILQQDPRHPGALHYLIHATDDPVHAPLGLAAARLYGQVAPGAAHAHHMPSHIFFALGLWDDAIAANLESLRVGRAHGDPTYHSLLWLVYAYLQQERTAPAEELVRSVAADVAAGATKENRARLAYARATWLVETRGSDGPDALTPVDNTGITNIDYFADYWFARGIEAAAAHRDQAREALQQIQALIGSARQAPHTVSDNWLDLVTEDELTEATLLADALEGTIRFHDGDQSGGILQVREASARASHLEFEYGPPWSVKPLDELLGELLIQAGRPTEAGVAFRASLQEYANRRLSRDGLERALAMQNAAAAVSALPAPAAAGTPVLPRREDLIGAWRLVSIDYTGPAGPLEDPFYHRGSGGMLVYDASGAMSVQITGAAAARPRLDVPGTRPAGMTALTPDATAKSAALDSYYAYFGTWDFDAATATATHHITSALIPAESGASYSQRVELIDGRLVMTNRSKTAAGEFVRQKTWERIGGPAPH